MAPKLYYNIASEETNTDIYIFGDITSWPWSDADVSAFRLVNQINSIPENQNITVHINSYGGEVAEGLAIYNALKNRKVTTICDGFAASAASVIFMGGKTRIMNPASLLFIHNASTFADGNAEELRKDADDLDKITAAIKEAYKESGVSLSDAEITNLMDEESWISPSDAVAWGFATEIGEAQSAEQPAASVRKKIFDKLTFKIDVEEEPDEHEEPCEPEQTDPEEPDVTDPTPEPADGENKGFFNFKSRKTAKEEK